MAKRERAAAEAVTMEYLGPSDHLIVGDEVYHRPVGGSVTVKISPAVAQHMAASATHHRFLQGGKEIRVASPAEQRGLVEAAVLASAEDMGMVTSDAGGASVVEAAPAEAFEEAAPAWQNA